jgi:hypothetical protein
MRDKIDVVAARVRDSPVYSPNPYTSLRGLRWQRATTVIQLNAVQFALQQPEYAVLQATRNSFLVSLLR